MKCLLRFFSFSAKQKTSKTGTAPPPVYKEKEKTEFRKKKDLHYEIPGSNYLILALKNQIELWGAKNYMLEILTYLLISLH